MDDGRRPERGHRSARLVSLEVRNKRDDNKHETGQGGGGRTNDDVKAFPLRQLRHLLNRKAEELGRIASRHPVDVLIRETAGFHGTKEGGKAVGRQGIAFLAKVGR